LIDRVERLLPQDTFAGEQIETALWVIQNPRAQEQVLFITSKQHICSAMNVVKAGGMIAAFQGGKRPSVLRPVANSRRYQLIGNAYVDGLIEGEAYQNLDPKTVDHDFELI
jgi:hypothetical protein